jgi:hypothetical protein
MTKNCHVKVIRVSPVTASITAAAKSIIVRHDQNARRLH